MHRKKKIFEEMSTFKNIIIIRLKDKVRKGEKERKEKEEDKEEEKKKTNI